MGLAMTRRFGAVAIAVAMALSLFPAAYANGDQLSAADAGARQETAIELSGQAQWQAGYVASKYKRSGSGKSIYYAKAGGKTVKAVPYTSGYPASYKLTVKDQGGKTRVLAKDVDYSFLTNGRYVFYARCGKVRSEGVKSQMQTLYRLDLRTGASKRVARGVNCYADACNGKYLYYVKGRVNGVGGALYALRLGFWKHKLVGKKLCDVVFSGSRIVANVGHQNAGYAVYSLKQDGTGKKLLAKSAAAHKVKGGKLVYIDCDFGYSSWYRVCQCSVTGANRKALSSWTTDWSTADRAYKKHIR